MNACASHSYKFYQYISGCGRIERKGDDTGIRDWFGGAEQQRRSNIIEDTAPGRIAVQQEQEGRLGFEEAMKVLKARAVEREPELLAQVPAAMHELTGTLRDRVDGFTCAFRRFGDFLTIEVEQAHDGPERCAQTINLARVPAIRFIEGHGVSQDRRGVWCYQIATGAGSGWLPLEQAHVLPPAVLPCVRRELIETSGAADSADHWSLRGLWWDDNTVHVTEGLPAADLDARIVFEGAGVTLHVPFGVGARAYRGLLDELARGAPGEIGINIGAVQ